MRYEEFRESLTGALRKARIRVDEGMDETMNVATTSRHCQIYVGSGVAQRAEPFWVTASISFDWSPLESARTYTNEDDLVSQLFGRHEEPLDTTLRMLRIDFELGAILPPHEKRTAIPLSDPWRSWSISVYERLADSLRTEAPEHRGRTIMVTGWGGKLTVKTECSSNGELYLQGVRLPTWQSVVLPRLRDDSEEDADVDVDLQLGMLAERYRDALDEWLGCVIELRERLDLQPPGP